MNTELFEGKPVFRAKNSKQLAEAVASYEGKAEPPYVVRIPDRTRKVAEDAFIDDMTIGVVLLPDSVKEIGQCAFYSCDNISHIRISESLESIDNDAFQMCTGLTEISLPDSLTHIGAGAFFGCENLKNISIPDSVQHIGEDAFEFCFGMHEIRINSNKLLRAAGLPDEVKIISPKGITLSQMIADIKKFEKKCSDWKVACLMDDGTPYYINDIDEDDEQFPRGIVLTRYSDIQDEFFTVSDIIRCEGHFSDSEVVVRHPFSTNPHVAACCSFCSLANLKDGIFFKAKDGDENIIAFRPGVLVYDDWYDEDEDD